MKRFFLVLAVAALMAVMLGAMTGPALAKGPSTCQGTLNANPSSGSGNAEPGQTGDRARTRAEAVHEKFGHEQANAGQEKDSPCDAGSSESFGPPKAFNPK